MCSVKIECTMKCTSLILSLPLATIKKKKINTEMGNKKWEKSTSCIAHTQTHNAHVCLSFAIKVNRVMWYRKKGLNLLFLKHFFSSFVLNALWSSSFIYQIEINDVLFYNKFMIYGMMCISCSWKARFPNQIRIKGLQKWFFFSRLPAPHLNY